MIPATDLHAYPDYRPSGVPWLENMPAHWEVRRAKWLFSRVERPVREIDDVVTCFRDGTVTLRKNRRVDGFTESLKEIGYQGVRRGDLVIHAMDAFAGAAGVSDSDGKCTPVYAICEAQAPANPYYYARLVREMARREWISALAKGVRERSTDFRFSAFASQPLALPPPDEQAAIVRFLDHADRRIQRYIGAKQRLIGLLEEQKQAVIQCAVTRGLDPGVRLKPSGVEWLGDVPEHWEVSKVKHLARSGYKSFVDGDWIESPYITSDGIRLIQTGNIGTGEYREKGFRFISEETFNKFNCTEFQPDDVLICRLGEPVARACLAPRLAGRMITSVDVCILKLRSDVRAQFVVYAMSSHRYLDWVGSLVRGSTRDRVSRSMLGSFSIPVPSLHEQTAIVRHLDDATANIGAAIDGARREIELLREYRTRLIADVVTGKLDVREAAVALPAEAADREDGAGMGRDRVASRRGRERGPGLAGVRDLE